MPKLKNAVFHVNEPVQLPIFQGLDYIGSLEVEGTTVVKIHYARRALKAAFDAFVAVRLEIIRRHGEESDGGHAVGPEMPGWAGYVAEYMALTEHEFEIAEVFTLDDIKGLRTKEMELRKLGDLFQWPEPKVKTDIEPAKAAA